MNKINLAIVGGQKCGTTALHFNLNSHPDISAPYGLKDIELITNSNKPSVDLKKYSNEYILGSNVNYGLDLDKLKKIKIYNSKIKLILLYRDPIERIKSSYLYAKERGLIKNISLYDLLKKESKANLRSYNNNFLNNQLNLVYQTNYKLIINNLLKVFEEQNIIVINYNYFKLNNKKTYESIFSYLNIKNHKIENRKINVTKGQYKFDFINKLIFENKYIILKKIGNQIIPNKYKKTIRDLLRRFNQKKISYKINSNTKKLIYNLTQKDYESFLTILKENDKIKKIGISN